MSYMYLWYAKLSADKRELIQILKIKHELRSNSIPIVITRPFTVIAYLFGYSVVLTLNFIAYNGKKSISSCAVIKKKPWKSRFLPLYTVVALTNIVLPLWNYFSYRSNWPWHVAVTFARWGTVIFLVHDRIKIRTYGIGNQISAGFISVNETRANRVRGL